MSAYIWTMVFARRARFVRCCTSLDKEMSVVGGGGGGGGKTTHPATHTPTIQHPPPCTQPAHHAMSLDSDSDPNSNVKTTHPVATNTGRVLTYNDGVRTVGMELDYSWSFVPFQAVLVHSELPGYRTTDPNRK